MPALSRLFPVVPALQFRWRPALIAFVAVAAATWLQLLRLSSDVAINTLWAEDGNIFLAGAVGGGRFHEFLVPYSGYLHFAPRALAVLASVLPLYWSAAVLGIGAAAVVALLSAFVYRAASGHIPSPRVRLMLAMIIVLIPATGFEVQDNVANLHWFFDFAAVWALLWRPAATLDRIVATLVVFLAATSDPLVALLVPLAVARTVIAPRWRELGPPVALIAGLAIQLPFVLSQRPNSAGPSALNLAGVFGGHVLIPFLFGGTLGGRLWGSFAWGFVALVSLVVVIALALLFRVRRLRLEALLALGLLTLAILFTVIPVYERWSTVFIPYPADLITIPARYYVVPLLLLWSGVAVVVGSERVRSLLGPRRTQTMVSVFSLWLIVLAAADFGMHNVDRDAGPYWKQEVAAAVTYCSSAPAGSRALFAPPPNSDYQFTIACTRVTG